MLVSATLNYLRISPRKVRRVAALLRGQPVPVAERQLTFAVQRSARPLLKLLRSAAANAEERFSLKPEELVVKQVLVNSGPILKRSLPRARGKVDPIYKRTSHVKLLLAGEKAAPAAGPKPAPTGRIRKSSIKKPVRSKI